MSGMERREWKMHNLHQSTYMALDDLESTCRAGLFARSKSNKELNRFFILASYLFDILKVKMLVAFDTGCLREEHTFDV